MAFADFILYSALVGFILYITYINNIWGVSKGTKKAKIDVRVEKSNQKKKKSQLWWLDKYVWVANNIGFTPNVSKQEDYKYKISRLGWEYKLLNRNIKPLELVGLMKIITIASCFVGTIGFALTGSIIFLVFWGSLFLPSLFHFYADGQIAVEDEELEKEFPDLYLVLYSRLVQGSKVRLAPTLNDYMHSLDAMHNGESNTIMKKFVMDLRTNIEIYGDDSIAITKLREKYTSVMIINFCNLAAQALNGVDNSDKLLAFKIELSQKRMDMMKKRADRMVAKGGMAVNIIYVILFQFVVLSWAAKFSMAGGIGSIFG